MYSRSNSNPFISSYTYHYIPVIYIYILFDNMHAWPTRGYRNIDIGHGWGQRRGERKREMTTEWYSLWKSVVKMVLYSLRMRTRTRDDHKKYVFIGSDSASQELIYSSLVNATKNGFFPTFLFLCFLFILIN